MEGQNKACFYISVKYPKQKKIEMLFRLKKMFIKQLYREYNIISFFNDL